MRTYLYRLGDGNEGNYPRFLVTLADSDDLFAALAALVENRYIVGSRTRRYIRANVATDGEPEFGIRATVYEGPKGEKAFDAAWITAELEPLTPEDLAHYEGQSLQAFDSLRDAIDLAAWRHYKQTAGA